MHWASGAEQTSPISSVLLAPPAPLPDAGQDVGTSNAYPGLRVAPGRDFHMWPQPKSKLGLLVGPAVNAKRTPPQIMPGWYSVVWDGAFDEPKDYRIGHDNHDLTFA